MLRLPSIQGVIDRRILVNYRVDADTAARILPTPFRPKLIKGYALAGICLIRLKRIRPAFLPLALGIESENAAHRFAVEWDFDGQRREGVFIPRRDTASRLNSILGGRIFPGEHHHARFTVDETKRRLRVMFHSDDGLANVYVSARPNSKLPANSVFESIQEASSFFQGGAMGYSATQTPGRYDGLELRCNTWAIQSLAVDEVRSTYFEDRARFPEGSATFDCALLMRDIDHQWHSREDVHGDESART